MIVDTEFSRFEVDGLRARFVERLAVAPEGHPFAQFFDADGRPLCYLETDRDADGWAACESIVRPVVGERFRLVWHTGKGMSTSRIVAVEED